jgi:hypothetical protein
MSASNSRWLSAARAPVAVRSRPYTSLRPPDLVMAVPATSTNRWIPQPRAGLPPYSSCRGGIRPSLRPARHEAETQPCEFFTFSRPLWFVGLQAISVFPSLPHMQFKSKFLKSNFMGKIFQFP